MVFYFWVAIFLVSNMLGIRAFSAAFSLPREEGLLPLLVSFPLIGLCAWSAGRMLAAWHELDEES